MVLRLISPQIVHSISQATYWNSTWISFAVVFIGFLGVRHFGQGQMTMTSRTMLGLWFEKRRGLVLGLSGSIVAFCFGLAPMLLNYLIEIYGWQKSLQILALSSFCMSLFSLLIFRRSPEHSGLQLDGGLLPPPKEATPAHSKEAEKNIASEVESEKVEIKGPSFTCEQAKRTLVFWAFNLGLTSYALILTAIVFHMASFAKFHHMSTAKAFSVFLPLAAVSTITDLLCGYLSDRIRLKYLLALMQVGLFAGLIGLVFFSHPLGFALMAVGMGVSGGLHSLLTGVAWPKLFGRKHLGSIAGFSMAWMVSGSAIGPYLYSLAQSFSGNYNLAIYISLVVPVSLFLISFKIKNPLRTNKA